jgi:hypothetical protein
VGRRRRIPVGTQALEEWASGGRRGTEEDMNIFYIIGVVVVVLFVLGYFGLR